MGNIIRVSEGNAYIIERFGKFSKILKPGINYLSPFHNIAFKHVLKETNLPLAKLELKTKDNLQVYITGDLCYKILDPLKFSYESINPLEHTKSLIHAILRNEFSKLDFNQVIELKETLNQANIEELNKLCERWGIKCDKFIVKNIEYDKDYQQLNQLEIKANLKKKEINDEYEDMYTKYSEEIKKINAIYHDIYHEELIQRAKDLVQKIDNIKKQSKNGKIDDASKLLLIDSYIRAFVSNKTKQNPNLISNDQFKINLVEWLKQHHQLQQQEQQDNVNQEEESNRKR